MDKETDLSLTLALILTAWQPRKHVKTKFTESLDREYMANNT